MKPDERISASRELMQNPYAYLDGEGGYAAVFLGSQRRDTLSILTPDEIRGMPVRMPRKRGQFAYSKNEIEQIVQRLHAALWQQRARLWSDGVPEDPVELLDPAMAARLIGFEFRREDSLGQFMDGGNRIEVAGIIDADSRRVSVSRQFEPDVQNFTAAHEIAHAILHPAQALHRDRPQDGSQRTGTRDPMEAEAEQFAAAFLMPRKLVKSKFEELFLTTCFRPSPETSFALGRGVSLIDQCKELRDLSMVLAEAELYNGRHFNSLAWQFRVSPLAMAIRLEELNLVAI